MFRRPALALGEIAWRWAFGAAAWTLVVVAVYRILAQVDVTEVELAIARRSDMFQIADAFARILVQVLPQFARECLVLAPAIAVLWIAAATVGRAVTLQTLLAAASSARPHFGRLAVLNTVRAIFTLATVIALFGALFLAGLAFPAQDRIAAVVAGMLVAAVIGFFWSLVNWFLALAPIWIVRDDRQALESIADSVDLYRRIPGPYIGIATGFGVFRAAALVAAVITALVATQGSPVTAVALSIVIALVYLAIADFLYIARLAAFVALEESTQLSALGSQPVSPAPEPIVSPEM